MWMVVEKKLKTDLERELAYIEERDKLEQETKEYFGEKMYATLKEIKESRERALVIDSGNLYQNKTSLRKQSYQTLSLHLITKFFCHNSISISH